MNSAVFRPRPWLGISAAGPTSCPSKAPKVTGTDYKVSGIDAKGRVTCSPMNLSRIGVYLWKQGVEKAGSFEVDKVREALIGQKFKGPAGDVMMQDNHHL